MGAGPGTSSEAKGIRVDNTGRTYVTGETNGNFDGVTKSGRTDVFITTKMYQ